MYEELKSDQASKVEKINFKDAVEELKKTGMGEQTARGVVKDMFEGEMRKVGETAYQADDNSELYFKSYDSIQDMIESEQGMFKQAQESEEIPKSLRVPHSGIIKKGLIIMHRKNQARNAKWKNDYNLDYNDFFKPGS